MLWDIWSMMVLSLICLGFFIPLGILNVTLFPEIYGYITEEESSLNKTLLIALWNTISWIQSFIISYEQGMKFPNQKFSCWSKERSHGHCRVRAHIRTVQVSECDPDRWEKGKQISAVLRKTGIFEMLLRWLFWKALIFFCIAWKPLTLASQITKWLHHAYSSFSLAFWNLDHMPICLITGFLHYAPFLNHSFSFCLPHGPGFFMHSGIHGSFFQSYYKAHTPTSGSPLSFHYGMLQNINSNQPLFLFPP